MPPNPALARYIFTFDQVLDALDRKMREIDDQNGVTFIEPDHDRSRKKLFHRVTVTADGLTVDVFEHPPADRGEGTAGVLHRAGFLC